MTEQRTALDNKNPKEGAYFYNGEQVDTRAGREDLLSREQLEQSRELSKAQENAVSAYGAEGINDTEKQLAELARVERIGGILQYYRIEAKKSDFTQAA